MGKARYRSTFKTYFCHTRKVPACSANCASFQRLTLVRTWFLTTHPNCCEVEWRLKQLSKTVDPPAVNKKSRNTWSLCEFFKDNKHFYEEKKITDFKSLKKWFSWFGTGSSTRFNPSLVKIYLQDSWYLILTSKTSFFPNFHFLDHHPEAIK